MSHQNALGAGEYILVPANSIDDERLLQFAGVVWPDNRTHDAFLSSWWRRADPACAVAAIHQRTNAMAAVCAGRPSTWIVDGQRHPAVAICDWYVAPGHAGRLIGRRLVRQFDAPDRLMHAFSMSEDAIAYLTRLGWVGPHAASLLLLPLPRVVRMMQSVLTRANGVELEEFVVESGVLPPGLAASLDRIEEARTLGSPAHMRRDAGEWTWRLGLCGERRYHFCVAHRAAQPVGYAAVRRMTPGRSRVLGRVAGAIVTDLAAVGDDPVVLRALGAGATSLAARLGVPIAIAATSCASHRRALAAVGYLSPGLPLLGGILARRSPKFMWLPRGPAARLAADRMALTFADSDVDFKL